jgi:hypothetical protein
MTLAELVERASAVSGGTVGLRRRMGISVTEFEQLGASQRVLGLAEATDLARALGLDLGRG